MSAPSGDELAFLLLLKRGKTFEEASRNFEGNLQLSVPYRCIQQGWMSAGKITAAGLALVEEKLKPVPWEITVGKPGEFT